MNFKWIQRSTKDYEMQKWSLVYKESRIIVLDMWFSPFAEHRQNNKIRRKIQIAYELYFQAVWVRTLQFF